jgi:maleate cis-trans isomerase
VELQDLNFNQSESIIGTCSQSKFKTEMNNVEYHQSHIPFGPVVSENLQTMDDDKENMMTDLTSLQVKYITF